MLTGAMVFIGDRLGLYEAIADAGAVSSAELAEKTGTAERYVRDWLVNQAASGYVEYDVASGRYSLSPEQREAFTNHNSPFYVPGGFQGMYAATRATPRIMENFRTGGGISWGEHDPNLFEGTERFFKPGYLGNLVQAWLPALDGVVEKLERGASVADVGCGHGASTVIMAQAYPNSRFHGFDFHPGSIERARRLAAESGVADRTAFEVGTAQTFPGEGYDLVAFFDCLHDMADPEGAAARALATLKPDGHVLLVEPMAGRTVEENFNPVGRLFAAASTMICTQNAIAGGGTGIGTIATDGDLQRVFTSAGFSQFRRATETPFNRIFEARP
jgi:2-polyprenyl-3-methyl-5-hydroxy-6-metoxy-1,4-benzoquinol methylase